jgi:indole-3-glycerol phosphate synthase
LRTFEVRLETTLDLLPRISKDHVVVTESGISMPGDVALMLQYGVHTFLVGEVLIKATDPGLMLASLFTQR